MTEALKYSQDFNMNKITTVQIGHTSTNSMPRPQPVAAAAAKKGQAKRFRANPKGSYLETDTTLSANESESEIQERKTKKASANILSLQVKHLQSRLSHKEKIIENLVDRLDIIESRLKAVETNNTSSPAPFSQALTYSDAASKSIPTRTEAQIAHALRIDAHYSYNRANNILLMGVKSPEATLSDKDKLKAVNKAVRDILRALEIDPPENQLIGIYRFNAKPGSPYPPIIRVMLKSSSCAQHALSNSKYLKDFHGNDNMRVYVNPDLTPLQLAAEKELINQRNELNKKLPEGSPHYYAIRFGEIKKLRKRTG